MAEIQISIHSGYVRGCRCLPCYDANAAYQRDYRAWKKWERSVADRAVRGELHPSMSGPALLNGRSSDVQERDGGRAGLEAALGMNAVVPPTTILAQSKTATRANG